MHKSDTMSFLDRLYNIGEFCLKELCKRVGWKSWALLLTVYKYGKTELAESPFGFILSTHSEISKSTVDPPWTHGSSPSTKEGLKL